MNLDELVTQALKKSADETAVRAMYVQAVNDQTAALKDLAAAVRELRESNVALISMAKARAESVEKSDETPAPTPAEKPVEPAPVQETEAAPEPVDNSVEKSAEEPVDKSAEPAPAKPIDREAVKDLCTKVAEQRGPQIVIGALASLGVTRLTKLPDDKLPELAAILEKRLAGD